MKKMKIFALILTAIMIFTMTGCGVIRIEIQADQLEAILRGIAQPVVADENPVAPAPVDETNPTPAEDTTAAPADETNPAPAEDTTAAPTDETKPAPVENTTAAPANTAPSTKDEIIAYYVAAYNKIASDSTGVVRTYDYTSNYNNIVEVNNNERLAGLASSLMNQFMKEDFSEVAGTAADLPPVGVTTLSISPSQVSNATITDNGSTYTVTLYSTGTDDNYEVDAQVGQGSAGVIGPLLRTEDVAGAAGSAISFDGLHAYYPTGKVIATIDKASGHITNLEYACPCILHFDSVTALFVIKISNANIGLLFQQKWTVNY